MTALLITYVAGCALLLWLCAWIHLHAVPHRVMVVGSLVGIGLPVMMLLVAVAIRGCQLR